MDSVKVIFIQDTGNGELQSESLWCKLEKDGCIVDNIPFVARRVSLGDKIKVEYDEDENKYYFDDFIEISGNTTLRVFFKDIDLINPTGKQLENLGCVWEGFLQRRMIAVNVPKNQDYLPVKEYLDKGENEGIWTYEESCLCHD
jgi:hypothetical protein